MAFLIHSLLPPPPHSAPSGLTSFAPTGRLTLGTSTAQPQTSTVQSGGLKLGGLTSTSGAMLSGAKTGLSGVGSASAASGTSGAGSKYTYKQLENLVNKVLGLEGAGA